MFLISFEGGAPFARLAMITLSNPLSRRFMFVFSCANLVNGVESSMGISVYKLDKFEPQILSDSAHKWSSFKINLSRQFLIRFSTPSESEGSRFVHSSLYLPSHGYFHFRAYPPPVVCLFSFHLHSLLCFLYPRALVFECSFSAGYISNFPTRKNLAVVFYE